MLGSEKKKQLTVCIIMKSLNISIYYVYYTIVILSFYASREVNEISTYVIYRAVMCADSSLQSRERGLQSIFELYRTVGVVSSLVLKASALYA